MPALIVGLLGSVSLPFLHPVPAVADVLARLAWRAVDAVLRVAWQVLTGRGGLACTEPAI